MDIVDFLKGFLNEDSQLIIEKENEMSNEALYDAQKRTIYINESIISESAERYEIDLNIYALIIYLHEFGHATDSELPEIDLSIIEAKNNIYEKGFNDVWFKKYAYYSYKAEENAWNLAEGYINESYLEDFSRVRNNSLKQHQEVLKYKRKVLKHNHKANI